MQRYRAAVGLGPPLWCSVRWVLPLPAASNSPPAAVGAAGVDRPWQRVPRPAAER